MIDSICRATAKEKSRHTADTFPRAYEAAALIFRAAASLCPAQDRRPTEGAAMIAAFRQNHIGFTLSKKAFLYRRDAVVVKMNTQFM